MRIYVAGHRGMAGSERDRYAEAGVDYGVLDREVQSSRQIYDSLLQRAKETGSLAPPPFAMNAPTKLMKEMGYGKGYEKYPGAGESYLPEKLKGKKYLRKPPKE